ncbi:hypothetical protein Hdeb2414_s0676g00934091 [Helianthus debilis subsp. tardiflorus]
MLKSPRLPSTMLKSQLGIHKKGIRQHNLPVKYKLVLPAVKVGKSIVESVKCISSQLKTFILYIETGDMGDEGPVTPLFTASFFQIWAITQDV